MHSLGSRVTHAPPGTFGGSQAGRPPTQGHALRLLGHLSGRHPSEAGPLLGSPGQHRQTASCWPEGGERGQGRAVLNCFVSCQKNPGFLSFPSPDFQQNGVDFDPFKHIAFRGGILLSQSEAHSCIALRQYKE